MFVFLCVWLRVRLCVCLCVCLHMCLYVYLCMCLCVYFFLEGRFYSGQPILHFIYLINLIGQKWRVQNLPSFAFTAWYLLLPFYVSLNIVVLLRNFATCYEFGFSLACLFIAYLCRYQFLVTGKKKMLLQNQATPVVRWRQKIVRENRWGDGRILFLCCVYIS